MPTSINEVMTHDPRTVSADSTLTDAARFMRDDDVGAIVVEREGSIAGIVTDRDIVVRAVADGRDPGSTRVQDGRAAGIVSLGDVAVHGDAEDELTDISAASPNN